MFHDELLDAQREQDDTNQIDEDVPDHDELWTRLAKQNADDNADRQHNDPFAEHASNWESAQLDWDNELAQQPTSPHAFLDDPPSHDFAEAADELPPQKLIPSFMGDSEFMPQHLSCLEEGRKFP